MREEVKARFAHSSNYSYVLNALGLHPISQTVFVYHLVYLLRNQRRIFLSTILSDSCTRISIGVRKDVICWHSSPSFNVLFRQERQYRAARDQMVICSSTMWPPSWQTESAVLSTDVTSLPPGPAAIVISVSWLHVLWYTSCFDLWRSLSNLALLSPLHFVTFSHFCCRR